MRDADAPVPDPSVISLEVLSRENLQEVRRWRQHIPATLRTTFPQTMEMQHKFYDDVICNSASPHRYWGVWAHTNWGFVGMVGLTYIDWVNGSAEISLITSPGHPRQGYGRNAVRAVLAEAFHAMRLSTVYGEVYLCNPAVAFWQKMVDQHKGLSTYLPRRKFWEGRLWDSYYFAIRRETFQ